MKILKIYATALLLLLVCASLITPTIAEAILREKKPFVFNFPDIQYSNEEIAHDTIPTVEIFPSNYESTVSALGEIDQHSKTRLLRYSQTLQKNENIKDIKDGYTYLKEKNISAVIPQEYINIYLISKAYNLSKIIKSKLTNEEILNAFEFQTKEYTQLDICKDIPDTAECEEMIERLNENFNINTTLPVLYDWIFFTDYSTENGYNQYIHKQLKEFSLNMKYEKNIVSQTEIPLDIYWDTDINSLKKLKYLFEYLEDIYSQTGIEDEETDALINENMNTLKNLISGDSSNLETLAKNILGSSILNDESKTEIYFDWKVIDINEEQKIYALPMYIYQEDIVYEINDNNFNEPYDYQPTSQAYGTVRVPIFMYHQIADVPAGSSFKQGLYVTPDMFEKQVAYLVKMNYKTISSKELHDLLATGKNPFQKTVVLTFDDSVRNHYTTAYPILKKYGLTGIFYIVSNRSSIQYTELKEMSDNGMEIGSHTSTHIDLKKETSEAVIREQIYNSKATLQSATGKAVYSIAYPGCVADSRTFSNVAGAGYLIGTSCGRSIDHRYSGRLSLSRIHVFNDMQSFIRALSDIN